MKLQVLFYFKNPYLRKKLVGDHLLIYFKNINKTPRSQNSKFTGGLRSIAARGAAICTCIDEYEYCMSTARSAHAMSANKVATIRRDTFSNNDT